jgi:hypothetical protein
MSNPRHLTRHARPAHRRPLPLFFFDLETASKSLPPVAVLPEQFYQSPTGVGTTRGETALMRAVLEDALACFQQQFITSERRAQRLAREAEEWFFSDDRHWLFSFVSICAVLGLEPGYLRRGLKQWHQHRSAEPRKRRQRAVPVSRPLKIAA